MASSNTATTSIGFIGLGAMGFGMACNLSRKSQYRVTGYDVFPPSAQRFADSAGFVAESPKLAAENSEFLVCMAANSQQIDQILFSEETGALKVSPEFQEFLPSRITEAGRPDVKVVDCPVSGGTARAADGTLTIFASGETEALQKARGLLDAMSEKLYVIPGGTGAASKVKMVNQLLVGTHIAAAAEAMALAALAGLNTREVYEIIRNAAGNSWAFENRVPHMLEGNWTPHSALDIFVKDMGIVVSSARALQFPLPLASAVEQLYISGSSVGYGKEDDAGLVRLFLPATPNAVMQSAQQIIHRGEEIPSTKTNPAASKIGFIGLGAMGQGMAASLLRAGYFVQGFDVHELAIDKFLLNDGKAEKAASAAEAVRGAKIVFLMVQNASQVDNLLFGNGNAVESLSEGAVVILSSTVSPSFVKSLEKRLAGLEKDISLIDAPVSGGVVRAANGTLTIICSGQDSVIAQSNGPLMAVAGVPENLCHVQGGVGAASSVKLINQHLAGIHIASAAEAMAFSARLGLNTRSVFETLKHAAAWSWMFENRVPQMLDADWTAHSALAIFVKDLGIVLDEAKRLLAFAPIASAAHTLYLAGAARGLSTQADAGVVRVWDFETGVFVAENSDPRLDGHDAESHEKVEASSQSEPQPTPAQQMLAKLPVEYPSNVLGTITELVTNGSAPVLVVLDDDPTGTQTCHDIDVLMAWDSATLDYEFGLDVKGFFILTNSRALPPTDARRLIVEITRNVKQAAEKAGKPVEIVLRGDSTLRGHLPQEPEAVEEVLGKFDAWIIAPFFFEGGRLTIDDVHYVKEEELLVPASQTPFAQDATFGYKNSNLRQYVMEKCGSRFDDSSFLSITLDDIRMHGPTGVAQKLLSAPTGSVVIVNAAAESDMGVFVAGLLEAGRDSRRPKYLYRTGAAFVSTRLGIKRILPLTFQDIGGKLAATSDRQPGGLIVAGSYVPKTTAQLRFLRESRGDKLVVIELEVAQLIASQDAASALISVAAVEASRQLERGQDVLVMTSRTLVKGSDALNSLEIGSKIAHCLVLLVELIQVRPRYLIAKGGITSSDAATKGLKMRRARIVGQAAPGVPLWRCDEPSSRFSGIPYIVFPGNVGTEKTLAEVVEAWEN
ncbi:ketose-bisphosphate aldolase class-ii family protein [Diaporthe amygdali]|uniref:ketose-bisphosphate aldolase class-ii family protein n=1 Tax=Phomopsis amygdali TaxID=1214568 RepID=UPI0022FEAE6D|nr:ketose-bisphosphate aldolase class-ii family protein [Diaporthe amygdali]KAJ0109347.1 ketose-bisphosphate aldolase class-ii family protein [Diaporthe amygdali]